MSERPERSPEQQIERLERRLARERDARRQAEVISERGMRELWLANRELDARVEERTKTLAAALEDLQVATSSRDRFLAMLSHEIRTPLNGMLGMLELIESHVTGEQGELYVRAASESAERLRQLTTRLLDVVELDSGRFTPNPMPVEVREFAEDVRRTWQHAALKSGHLLTIDASGSSVSIDAPRVQQILNELVHNAVTHAAPGAIRVRIECDGESLTVSVEDSGPGIQPDKIDDLLNSDFSMIDDTTARAAQGLGLGLGISRRIAEAIGGSLEVTSDGETHSVATLRVPVAKQAETQSREAA